MPGLGLGTQVLVNNTYLHYAETYKRFRSVTKKYLYELAFTN